MTPFTIQCTTCRRSLRVVDPQAIGQILACPKCGSMVLVQANSELAAEGQGAIGVTQSMALAATPVIAEAVIPTVVALPTAAKIAAAKMGVTEDSAQVVELSSGEPVIVTGGTPLPVAEEVAAESSWPRWFVPSLIALSAVCALIFAVRMMSPRDGNEKAANDAPEVKSAAVTAPSEKAEEPTATAPVSPPATSGVTAEKTPESGKTSTSDVAKQAAPAAVPQAEVKPEVEAKPTTVATRPSVVQSAPTAEVEQNKTTEKRNSAVAEAPASPANLASGNVPPAPMPMGQTSPASTAPARVLQRAAPRQVNVDARLAEALGGIEAQGMPLWAYLDRIGELSSIPITLDGDAVVNLGQSAVTPVQVKLEQTTVAGAIEAALDPLRLGYQVRDGELIVGYPPQENMRQVRYAVGDLADGDEKSLAEFGALLRRMVAPESWQQAGGKGTMIAGGDTLVIEQTDPVHMEVLNFCEKLRVARGKAIKSKYDPARFVLSSHLDKAHEILNRGTTANFGAPQPLADVVNWLRTKTGVVLLVDQAALARQGISDDSECAAVGDNKPLAALLDSLLAGLELTWRAVDEKTIEITTQQAAAAQMDVEFYPVSEIAGDAAKGHGLVTRISGQVDAPTWGEDASKGALYFDVPAKTLVVRAPQKVQGDVEAFLATLRKRS